MPAANYRTSRRCWGSAAGFRRHAIDFKPGGKHGNLAILRLRPDAQRHGKFAPRNSAGEDRDFGEDSREICVFQNARLVAGELRIFDGAQQTGTLIKAVVHLDGDVFDLRQLDIIAASAVIDGCQYVARTVCVGADAGRDIDHGTQRIECRFFLFRFYLVPGQRISWIGVKPHRRAVFKGQRHFLFFVCVPGVEGIRTTSVAARDPTMCHWMSPGFRIARKR